MTENLNNLPPFLGGEAPWYWLSPEGEAQVRELNHEQREQLLEVRAVVSKVFDSQYGRQLLDIMRRMVKSNVRFQPGLTMDQAAGVLIWNDAQTAWLDWIEQQIKMAKEL